VNNSDLVQSKARRGLYLSVVIGGLILILTFQWMSVSTAQSPETLANADASVVNQTQQQEDPAVNQVPRSDDIIAGFIYVVFIVLLLRTAAGTRNSRFLRHLAYSLFPIVMFRFGRFIYEWKLQGLPEAHATWDLIDIMLAVVNTYWLFLAWRLLSRYPSESVDRGFYTITTSVVGASAAILALIPKPSDQAMKVVLLLFDSVLACIALVLIGSTMVRKLTPWGMSPIHQKSLRALTLVFYLAWGFLQLFYTLFKNNQTYFSVLLMSGMGTLLMTVVYAALSLQDRYGTQLDENAKKEEHKE
jgi:hypothetical protein